MIWTESSRRVLAAVRPVDATTGVPLGRALQLTSEDALDAVANRSGMLVIRALPGFEAYREAWSDFDDVPAGELNPRTFTLTLADPLGEYLPRRFSIVLPRLPDEPARALFTAVDVRMFPGPAARSRPGWGVVRVSVRTPEDEEVPGALLRLDRTSGPSVDGMTDHRGEGVLFVPGIRLTTWSDDPVALEVIERDVAVNVTAWFDLDDIVKGRRVRHLDPDLPDPDRAALRTASTPAPLRLASGGTLPVRLTINIHP